MAHNFTVGILVIHYCSSKISNSLALPHLRRASIKTAPSVCLSVYMKKLEERALMQFYIGDFVDTFFYFRSVNELIFAKETLFWLLCRVNTFCSGILVFITSDQYIYSMM
jgi:hypothetical protein